jgi:hypothetical protein
MMPRSATPALAAALAALLLSPTAHAVTPPTARVKSAALAGSGCPAQNTVEAKLSADAARLDAILPALSATIGGAAKTRIARVNCQLIITIEHTAGYQLAPTATRVDVSGRIGAGSDGQLSYKYYFQGQAATPAADVLFSTPGTLTPHVETLKTRQEFGPCGTSTTLVQSYALRLLAKGARDDDASELKAASVGATELAWRACK